MTKEKLKKPLSGFQTKEIRLLSPISWQAMGLRKLESQIKTLEESGVDLIEIGIPFSDPAADGPVIQEAGIRALETSQSS